MGCICYEVDLFFNEIMIVLFKKETIGEYIIHRESTYVVGNGSDELINQMFVYFDGFVYNI